MLPTKPAASSLMVDLRSPGLEHSARCRSDKPRAAPSRATPDSRPAVAREQGGKHRRRSIWVNVLGRFLDADDKAFSERAQRFYHRREFRRVLRIENTADFLFILAHAPAQFALSDLGRREGLQHR